MLNPDARDRSLPIAGLLGRLIGLSQTLSDVLSHFASRYNLTESECRALLTLTQHNAISAKMLGALCGMHKTKISRLMRSLERRGLIECRRDMSDLRKVMLNLTTRGASLANEIAVAATELNSLLERTINKERDSMHGALDTLVAGMKAITRDS
jgi:DNA-binding MarR family transcriptional regulator